MKILIGFLLALFISGHASAEEKSLITTTEEKGLMTTTGTYLSDWEGKFDELPEMLKVMTRAWMSGALNSFLMTETLYLHKYGRSLTCIPENLVITHEILIQAMKDYVKENPHANPTPTTLTLALALERVFPCKK